MTGHTPPGYAPVRLAASGRCRYRGRAEAPPRGGHPPPLADYALGGAEAPPRGGRPHPVFRSVVRELGNTGAHRAPQKPTVFWYPCQSASLPTDCPYLLCSYSAMPTCFMLLTCLAYFVISACLFMSTCTGELLRQNISQSTATYYDIL